MPDINYKLVTLFIIFILFLFTFNTEASQSKVDPEVFKSLDNNFVDVIITLEKTKGFSQQASVRSTLTQEEFTIKRELNNAFSGRISKTALEKLEKDPRIKNIQLNHQFSVSLQDSLGLMNISNLHSKVLTNNLTGKNIGVCVLDTGINSTHSELSDNFADGYDFVNNDNDPTDDHGHGTHVSGIVEGSAPDIILIHNKVMNSGGSGAEDDIIAGINWCIGNKTSYNITVITMSLGTESPTLFSSVCDSSYTAFADAINDAIANNISVTAAAGNDGSTTEISSPACVENATAVGWTDKSDNIASGGNVNNLVALLATGSSINSTAIGGGYTTLSGTSMSTPHVAGAFALGFQFDFEETNSYPIPSTVQNAFKNTGVNVSDWVRIDADDAIITLDNTVPELTLFEPQTTNYTTTNITLNYSSSDIFLDTTWYNLNGGTNITLNGNTTLDLNGGTYTMNIYSNDSNSNENSSTIIFGIDLPNVTLNSPPDNTNDLDGLVEFNCSISDISGVSNLSLFHNQSETWEINQTTDLTGTENSTLFSLNLTGSLVFSWTCLGRDTDNNEDTGENRTLRINVNSAPVIDNFFPNSENISIIEPNNQTLNISYSDADNDILTVTWYKDGSSVATSDEYNFSGGYSTSGNYNITVIVDDTFAIASNFWNLTVNNTEACGDNIKNSTETCDDSDLDGQTCSSQGFDSGTLACSSTCDSFDTSSCSNDASGGSPDNPDDSVDSSESDALIAEADAASSSDSEDSDDSAVFSEEQILDTEAEDSLNEDSIEEITDVDKGIKGIGTIAGIIIGIVVVVLLFLFFRKEWRFILKKK